MPGGDLRSQLAATFWEHNDKWISATLTIVFAFAVVFAIDRTLTRLWGGSISRRTDTRLRFVRRLIYVTILLLGIALALSQFTGVNKLATSVLASGAIVAAVIGFAAQKTLGNFVAGVMLAVTQPLRIGDWVTFEDHHGVVEDVRLNFTVLRLPSDARVIIPNEKIASGVLRNDTLVVDVVGVEVALWLPRDADVAAAIQSLQEESGGSVAVAETTVDGIRLVVGGERVAPAERKAREADLRARCLRRLQADARAS